MTRASAATDLPDASDVEGVLVSDVLFDVKCDSPSRQRVKANFVGVYGRMLPSAQVPKHEAGVGVAVPLLLPIGLRKIVLRATKATSQFQMLDVQFAVRPAWQPLPLPLPPRKAEAGGGAAVSAAGGFSGAPATDNTSRLEVSLFGESVKTYTVSHLQVPEAADAEAKARNWESRTAHGVKLMLVSEAGKLEDDLVVRFFHRGTSSDRPVGHGRLSVKTILAEMEIHRQKQLNANGHSVLHATTEVAMKIHPVDKKRSVHTKSTIAKVLLSIWTPRVRRSQGCMHAPFRTEAALLRHQELKHLNNGHK